MSGNWLIDLMIGGGILVYFVVKVVGTVDGDGEIGKTTSEGIIACISRLFK
jgi:hypothetical protein